jgi:hypothetical protein
MKLEKCIAMMEDTQTQSTLVQMQELAKAQLQTAAIKNAEVPKCRKHHRSLKNPCPPLRGNPRLIRSAVVRLAAEAAALAAAAEVARQAAVRPLRVLPGPGKEVERRHAQRWACERTRLSLHWLIWLFREWFGIKFVLLERER